MGVGEQQTVIIMFVRKRFVYQCHEQKVETPRARPKSPVRPFNRWEGHMVCLNRIITTLGIFHAPRHLAGMVAPCTNKNNTHPAKNMFNCRTRELGNAHAQSTTSIHPEMSPFTPTPTIPLSLFLPVQVGDLSPVTWGLVPVIFSNGLPSCNGHT